MKKKKSAFRNKVTGNARKQKSQGAQYGYLRLPKGVNIFKDEHGTRVRLDFIPYRVTDPAHMDKDTEQDIAVPGGLWYKKPFKVHRSVGPSNESAVCPTTIGKKCPICEYRLKRMREGAEQEETKAMRPSMRNLYVVIPKGHKDYEEKLHIWDISQYLFQEMLNEELEENEDYGIFPDLEEGLTLKIRFGTGQIGKNKFAETNRIDFTERKEQYDEDILDDVPNLDEMFTILSYKELEAKFFEMEEEEEASSGEAVEDTGGPDNDDADTGIPDDDDRCIACEGSGKNSKGTPCRICKGTGEGGTQEEEEEEEEEKPKKKKERAKTKKDDRCPHDHKFGKDCEEYSECEDCDEWDYCIDAKEEK